MKLLDRPNVKFCRQCQGDLLISNGRLMCGTCGYPQDLPLVKDKRESDDEEESTPANAVASTTTAPPVAPPRPVPQIPVEDVEIDDVPVRSASTKTATSEGRAPHPGRRVNR